MQIRELFDTSKDIYRTIEKVITYGTTQEERLRREISEYVITPHIDEQLGRLLEKMQLAMDGGGEYEIGVWVSGFYGSGKSSFTKYLGFALDDAITIDGEPFRTYLQDRVRGKKTKALLYSTARRFPAAIVMLDLASEMVAGHTMEDVATVLYYKVLQWAGYSRNLKVAALERRLEQDGRMQEWRDLVEDEIGMTWAEIQNDTLAIESVVPELAHKTYPNLFRSESAFSTESADTIRFENERVAEMINIVREKSGRDQVIFIVDEVGQYVGSRPNLILNLDGLAKNLRDVGDGKVWIIGTAQQTLAEDDPNAALNSPQLYKLKDRFPIQVNLESRDIKAITVERLLAKSAEGEAKLAALFDQHGQQLRHNIKLEDAPAYEYALNRKTFIDLYPFLPAHFDILLKMLAVLAKSTGGYGLRSAIKVIQDILIEQDGDRSPAALNEVGWLTTAETVYDTLVKDIERAEVTIFRAVEKVTEQRFPNSPVHQAVAKTVGLLQILKNMPITRQNVAALLQPSVTAGSQSSAVDAAIEALLTDDLVPLGENDGKLTFFSEKLNEINVERGELPLRGIELKRIRNEALKEIFRPLPNVRIHDQLVVTAGLQATDGMTLEKLAGDNYDVQIQVRLALPTEFNAVRQLVIEDSRLPINERIIFLLGRTADQIDALTSEIFRSRAIAKKYRNDPDKEIGDYANAQEDRAIKLLRELQGVIEAQLQAGSFVFRGQPTATNSLALDTREAARKLLTTAGAQVFSRYDEAPIRVDTGSAEKFLRTRNLSAMTAQIDPLGLVSNSGGQPHIDADRRALVSIRERIEREGTVDGKRLTAIFTAPPFGWSADTLRYLVAALLIASEIKLKVGGRDITTAGQQAVEALRTNNAFKKVGIALRDSRPSMKVLAQASTRLTALSGKTVLPLEKDVGQAAIELLPRLQQRYSGLAERLENLGLPGADDVRAMQQQMIDLSQADGSDAPAVFGAEQSALNDRLLWAREVYQALKNGLDKTVYQLQTTRRQLAQLPRTGILGDLHDQLQDDLAWLGERLGQTTFYNYAPDLNTRLTTLHAAIRTTAQAMAQEQQQSIRSAQESLQQTVGWAELTQEEQSNLLGQLEPAQPPAAASIEDVKNLLNQTYTLQQQTTNIRQRIAELAESRRMARLQDEHEQMLREGRTTIRRTLVVPAKPNLSDLDALLQQIKTLRSELNTYDDIDITITLKEDTI